MKVDNHDNELARLETLMKVMRTSDDDEKLSPEEESLLSDAETRHDLYLLASAERALTESSAPLPDVEGELERITAPSRQEVSSPVAPVSSRHTLRVSLLSALIGAAAMLAVILCYHFWQPSSSDTVPPMASVSSQPMVAETAQGQTMTLHLADGTSITLNENSRLTYPRTFGKGQRVVRLVGEALFKVKHDAAHPFIVETAAVRTRVLGTVFDVKAYQGSQARVALVEGSVMVSDKAGHHSRRIRPGEAAETASGGRLSVSRVNTEMETAWSEGMVYYDNKPLQDVLDDLAQRYHVAVVFKASELKTLHVNFATRRDATLDETLELLNSMGHFRVAHSDGLLTVTSGE